MAHHAADLGHIGDTLGEYVAGELQIFVRGLYRFSAPDGVGEGLEALLLRDLGARAALRLVRLVDIFEGALLPARGDLFAKAVRKLALFVDGLQYGLFAGLQLGVVFKTVFDLADGDFVEVAVGLFAVAGDKRHGSALGEKFFDGSYLARGRADLGDHPVQYFGIHSCLRYAMIRALRYPARKESTIHAAKARRETPSLRRTGNCA